MQRTKTWRDLLEVILRNPQEKQRLAGELNVSSFTLQRWARGEANPRTQHLQQLLQALPQHQKTLLPLIAEEFENVVHHVPTQTQEIEEIPSIFYAQLLRGCTTVPAEIRFWSLANIVLQQVLMQVDPYRKGLLVRVARFLPPWADGKLHCLREAVLQGTAPWKGELSMNAIMLGAESLAGQAVTAMQPVVINSPDDDNLSPTALRDNEVSVLAFPIRRGNRLAGAFLASSTQKEYFTPARLSLIHRYTDLLALTFESEDFYEPERLDLGVMPEVSEQLRQLSTFRQRVATLLTQAAQQQQPMDTTRAELQVWQLFAEEFHRQAS